MSHLLLLPSRLRLSLLCAGAAFAASSVTAVSHAAPPPTPTVTLANPTPVPTGIAAGKALGVAPMRAVGTSTVLSGLLRYADGTISAKTGTPFERTLAARLDRVPNAKFHAVNAVSPFRFAPPAERQRILPGVTATTIGAGPLNRIDVRKAASQNVAVPNFGQFEVVSGPFIPAPDAPPITYHLDFSGVRCNTPPQNGIAPLVVINEIETTGTSYVTTTQVVPASGTGTSMAAGAISTNGVGPLFDAPSRSLTTLGSGNGGVLLVTAVLQPTSAADAQAQRDRLNLLLATAEVYAAGLSGGSTLVNMQTAVTFTMGVIALSGVGYLVQRTNARTGAVAVRLVHQQH